MDTPVFDASRPIAINLRTPEGVKTIRVRFPSDDEWIERQRRRKAVIKQLGRGMSETTVANGEDVDAAMVAKIRTEETPEIDPFEAMKVSWRRRMWTTWFARATPSGSRCACWAPRPFIC